MSVRTIKLKYSVENAQHKIAIDKYIKNYNNILRYTYNRLKDYNFKVSTKELTQLQKQMNNVILDSHFLNSAQYEAKSYKDKGKVIFGGKTNFIKMSQGKISKEEFQQKRTLPLCSIGEAIQKGNRKFRITTINSIIFQPNRNSHIELLLPKLKKNYNHILSVLYELQENRIAPITYKLSSEYVYITFENNFVEQISSEKLIPNRIFSIDLNPNYIGWTITDWKSSDNFTLINSGVISNKLITDLENSLNVASTDCRKRYITNKRNYENIDTVKELIKLAIHYKCSIFSIEDLSINSKDVGKGKKLNKLINNQWNRNVFYDQIQRRCEVHGIKFQKVKPNYSSFIGNMCYRDTELPDMCLSSIEIARRAYEFIHQYVIKDIPINKNIIMPNSETMILKMKQSLEELNKQLEFSDGFDLYKKLKTLNLKYRVPLNETQFKTVCSKKSIKSKILLYSN